MILFILILLLIPKPAQSHLETGLLSDEDKKFLDSRGWPGCREESRESWSGVVTAPGGGAQGVYYYSRAWGVGWEQAIWKLRASSLHTKFGLGKSVSSLEGAYWGHQSPERISISVLIIQFKQGKNLSFSATLQIDYKLQIGSPHNL